MEKLRTVWLHGIMGTGDETKSQVWKLIGGLSVGPLWLRQALGMPAVLMAPLWFGPIVLLAVIQRAVMGKRKIGESAFADLVFVITLYLHYAIFYGSGLLAYFGLFMLVKSLVT